MKKFMFAMALLAVLIGAGIGYQSALSHFATEVEAYCEKIEVSTYAKDAAALNAAYGALAEGWARQARYMPYLIDHQHLNELSRAVDELGMAVYAQATPEILMVTARIRNTASTLHEDESFLPKNIF